MEASGIPVGISDPINAKILSISEDRIQGFHRDPLGEIARRSGVELPVVIERIRAMLEAGTIRRVRQTLMSTSLAKGALVAWKLPQDKLYSAFDYMFKEDPFSGHVVIRSSERAKGSEYRLWTTLKVPQGFSLEKHCEFLQEQTGAEQFRIMPAKRVFTLGVGHVRRRGLPIGSKSDKPAEVMDTKIVRLSELEWRVLTALKREFKPEEIRENIWEPRGREAGVPLETFYRVAEDLDRRGIIGRFSTFLEHVKPLATGERVTQYNALFHWTVPPGREIEAGREVGRFHILTHCYWREAGPEFGNVNIMAVAHGTDRDMLLQHKAAIDEHLEQVGIPIAYTNVFWGGRSEIKPSEISPIAYREWCERVGLDPEDMKEEDE
jgi:DNA-binding Lrp family transcriptional regulator